MKRIIAICALLVGIVLCSCGATVAKQDDVAATNMSMFIEIENTVDGWKIVYHRDTKVMYAVSVGYYNCGNFTLLVNADGTPMVYGG